MSSSVLFSVIIPTYNRSKQLSSALDSVLAQTCTDYEILVIDDGSTDDTEQVLRAYQDRLTYLRQSNAGISVARNTGIAQAKGAYIAFLDDDDLWYPRKLEVMAQAIAAHPDGGLFHSRVDYVDGKGNWLWTTNPPQGNDYQNLLQGNYIAMLSAVVKKSCLERAGVFDPDLKMCVDWDLFLRVAKDFPVVYVPETLAEYRYLLSDSVTARVQVMLPYQKRVLEKAIAADPTLPPAVVKRARAALAFRAGKSLAAAGDREGALQEFKTACSIDPLYWKAAVLYALTLLPSLQRILPSSFKRKLRLYENV